MNREKLSKRLNSARSIINRYLKNGQIENQKKGGRIRIISNESTISSIENIISNNPDYTLKEIKMSLLQRNPNITISLSTIDKCLKELGITFKIKHHELDRVNDPEKISQRKEYSLWFNTYFSNDFSSAIFVDETSANLQITKSQARSKIGTRANVRIPTVRGRSITMISSISNTRMVYSKVISNSTVNAEIFNTYLNELCKILKDDLKMRSAVLILDNARIHRRVDIEKITTEYGFTHKFLPPYSYMLNPIENAFSKIKNGVRSRLRVGEDISLSDLMLSETQNISSEDISGFFRYIIRNITNCAAEIPYNHQ